MTSASYMADFKFRLARLEAHDAMRLERARAVMSPHVREIFSIVPVLLHCNTPAIPGWRPGAVPYGIDMFEPDAFQRSWIRGMGVDPDKLDRGEYGIAALYAMGSTSSIGQGRASDLDIWVCVCAGMPQRETEALRAKCHFISVFCKSMGADVNLFVTPEDRFLKGAHGTLDTEDCGSAQSLFLLDEFYRSSVRICGRRIAWYMVSPDEERHDYAEAVRNFYKSGLMKKGEWIDFGSVTRSSPEEYFGSGLWLLYKGIDSPFKAALKITLMEAYAHEYPDTTLVSSEFKRRFWKGAGGTLGTDSYFLMFKKVSRYLEGRGDAKRLELMRRCFYIKLHQAAVSLDEDSPQRAFRLRLARRLARVFGWTPSGVRMVEGSTRWLPSMIIKATDELFSSYLSSYRALLSFSISHGIEYAITSDDAGALSRRLYAVYDSYEGKVLPVRRIFSANLAQRCLVFVRTGPDSLCRCGWHVYACLDRAVDLLSAEEIHFSEGITESVLWCVMSGFLTRATKVVCRGETGQVDAGRIKRLASFLARRLPDLSRPVPLAALRQTRRVSGCIAVVNFERDATFGKEVHGDSEGGALNSGPQKRCLIGSQELITFNTWGEANYQSFQDGAQGLVDMLAYLARLSAIGGASDRFMRRVVICSCSRQQRESVRYSIEEILRELDWCASESKASFNFSIDGVPYTAKSSGARGVSIFRREAFGTGDIDITVLTRFGMRPEYALQVPPPVENAASAGIRQYFFEQKSRHKWDIYVANERNEISIFRSYKGSRAELVNAINRFYTRQSEEEGASQVRFNLPQYFVINRDRSSVRPFTISQG
jgi:adenylate cyclase class 1